LPDFFRYTYLINPEFKRPYDGSAPPTASNLNVLSDNGGGDALTPHEIVRTNLYEVVADS
jgi:hypothetical protein